MNGRTNASPLIILWLIHFSFIMAVPVYAVILVLVLAPEMKPQSSTPPPALMLAIFAMISVAQIVASFTIDCWLRLPQAPEEGQSSTDPVFKQLQTRMIIADALVESVAIYGLVGNFVGLSVPQSLGFMVVALVLLLVRIAPLRAWSDEYKRVKLDEAQGL